MPGAEQVLHLSSLTHEGASVSGLVKCRSDTPGATGPSPRLVLRKERTGHSEHSG